MRLAERDGLTGSEAAARIDAQMPLAEKCRLADAVISTEGPIEQTQAQVRRLLAAGVPQFGLRGLPVAARVQGHHPEAAGGEVGDLLLPDLGRHRPTRDEDQGALTRARIQVAYPEIPHFQLLLHPPGAVGLGDERHGQKDQSRPQQTRP